jgi:hypothetical protein
VDLDDARVVRTIVLDAIRSGASPDEPPSGAPTFDTDFDTNAAVAPGSDIGRRLRDEWAAEWRDSGEETVPVVVVDGAELHLGVDGVERLGTELRNRGLTSACESTPESSPAG